MIYNHSRLFVFVELNMTKIESPLGNQTFQERPMRHLEIPDESGFQSPPTPMGGGNFSPSVSRRFGTPMDEEEIRNFQERMQSQMDPESSLSEAEREFKRAREERKRGMTNLNEGARKRVEMLIGMTRVTHSVDIEGNTYVFQTLKGKEMREAILAASEFDGTVQSPFEIRKQMLARSLVQIAGMPISQFIGSDTLQAKFEMIDLMDDVLLNRLMDEYSKMVKEARNKYAIKSTEEVKEVVEDLKK